MAAAAAAALGGSTGNSRAGSTRAAGRAAPRSAARRSASGADTTAELPVDVLPSSICGAASNSDATPSRDRETAGLDAASDVCSDTGAPGATHIDSPKPPETAAPLEPHALYKDVDAVSPPRWASEGARVAGRGRPREASDHAEPLSTQVEPFAVAPAPAASVWGWVLEDSAAVTDAASGETAVASGGALSWPATTTKPLGWLAKRPGETGKGSIDEAEVLPSVPISGKSNADRSEGSRASGPAAGRVAAMAGTCLSAGK